MMDKRLAIGVCLFVAGLLGLVVGFAIIQKFKPPVSVADVTCNFKTGVATGVGAGTCISSLPACDGVTNDQPAIAAFRDWAINTWQPAHVGLIQLLIPSSTCPIFVYNDEGQGIFGGVNQSTGVASGIKKVVVSAHGVTMKGTFAHLAFAGQYQGNNKSVRLATVSAGATSVVLNPSSVSQPAKDFQYNTGALCTSVATCAALFTVGGYALIGGVDLQTGQGFPSNFQLYEYVKITAINSLTGVINLELPLVYAYKSTWPNFNNGDGGFLEPDDGGPATLYAFCSCWDGEVEWQGITFDKNTNASMDVVGRKVVFRDVVFTNKAGDIACVYPTMTHDFQLINASMAGCTMENDKLNDSVTMDNVTLNIPYYQSSGGAKLLTINNSKISTFIGMPYRAVISNSTIGTLTASPLQAGFTKSISLNNVTATNFGGTVNEMSAGVYSGVPCPGHVCPGVENATDGAMTAGVLRIRTDLAKSEYAAIGTFGIGANICWSDASNGCFQLGQVTDLSQDATYTYVHTTGLTDYGSLSWTKTGTLSLRVFPALQFTCVGCNGVLATLGLNTQPAATPLYSYSKRTYTKADTANMPSTLLYGNLVSMKISVDVAHAGGAATFTPNTLFLEWAKQASSADTVLHTPIVVDATVPGTRSLNTSGGYPAAWTGPEGTRDTRNSITDPLWAPTQFKTQAPDVSGSAGAPVVTIEVITNPGIVVPLN